MSFVLQQMAKWCLQLVFDGKEEGVRKKNIAISVRNDLSNMPAEQEFTTMEHDDCKDYEIISKLTIHNVNLTVRLMSSLTIIDGSVDLMKLGSCQRTIKRKLEMLKMQMKRNTVSKLTAN